MNNIPATQQRPVLLTPDLTNQLTRIEKDIDRLKGQIQGLQSLFGNSVSTSQLNLVDNRVRQLISSNAGLISNVEERLSMVALPKETRYYLQESEIEDFRANFQKLAAMIADVNELYDSLVAYVSNTTS
jgi:archaellum component FlaC